MRDNIGNLSHNESMDVTLDRQILIRRILTGLLFAIVVVLVVITGVLIQKYTQVDTSVGGNLACDFSNDNLCPNNVGDPCAGNGTCKVLASRTEENRLIVDCFCDIPNPPAVPPLPPVTTSCSPGQWASCGTHGCGSGQSPQCNSAGSGWNCFDDPATCTPSNGGGGGGGCVNGNERFLACGADGCGSGSRRRQRCESGSFVDKACIASDLCVQSGATTSTTGTTTNTTTSTPPVTDLPDTAVSDYLPFLVGAILVVIGITLKPARFKQNLA
jgi:hypothetical protein